MTKGGGAYLLYKIEEILHDIGVLSFIQVNLVKNRTTTTPRTASMPPSIPNVSNVACNSTPTTSRTTVSTSCDGTARSDTVYGAGGSSCIMSIFASASQTPVRWRCAARHTSSSSGPGGNDMSVASAASAVIDLNRSLSA